MDYSGPVFQKYTQDISGNNQFIPEGYVFHMDFVYRYIMINFRHFGFSAEYQDCFISPVTKFLRQVDVKPVKPRVNLRGIANKMYNIPGTQLTCSILSGTRHGPLVWPAISPS